MKRVLIIFILSIIPFLPISSSGFGSEGTWYYSIEDVVMPEYYHPGMGWRGAIVCGWYFEIYYLQGTEEVNDKTYRKLYVDESFYDVKAMYSFPRDQELHRTHILDIREENGRVYALKDMYIEYVKHHSPAAVDDNNLFLAEADDENEILLYDFTLEEGDTYPSLDSPTVERVGYTQLNNGEEKKVMRLSNGLIIVECLGCICSLGTLVCYQNTLVRKTKDNRDDYMWGYLYKYERDEDLFLASENEGIYTSIHSVKVTKPHTHSVFDLSGRRVANALSPSAIREGIPKLYIVNGEKSIFR